MTCIFIHPALLIALSTSESAWYILASSAGGRFGWQSARRRDKNKTTHDETVITGTTLKAAKIKGLNSSGFWVGSELDKVCVRENLEEHGSILKKYFRFH